MVAPTGFEPVFESHHVFANNCKQLRVLVDRLRGASSNTRDFRASWANCGDLGAGLKRSVRVASLSLRARE